ncbi:MAG: lycopene cyclase domain-containing protein [Acidimicrobiia bacterium]|nr:lycopene cyclase domain-containing protein [Acidimicrobiia bacterium]
MVAITLPLELLVKFGIYRRPLLTFKAISFPFVAYLLWDILFSYFDLWNFKSQHTYSFRFFGLPIEEILFFIIIPLAGLLTYGAVSSLRSKKFDKNSWTKLLVFGICYFLLGLISYQFRLSFFNLTVPKRIFPYYTLSIIFILAIFILWVWGEKERLDFLKSSNYFYTILICLFFMVIVNGYLTKLSDPVVTYRANLGSRIFYDMPFEDVIYGFVLLTWILIRFNIPKKPVEQ